MSVEILGNNQYEDVPLVDTDTRLWSEAAKQCDPLFQDLALSGLSALCHGIRQSEDPGLLDTLEFGELFDEAGTFVGDELTQRLRVNYSFLPSSNPITAGVHVTNAALTASRLFKEAPVITEDYVGQTGVSFIQRRVWLPVASPIDAGKLLNAPPVINVQARVFKNKTPTSDTTHTELAFAAALYNLGELPLSITTLLGGSVDRRDSTTRASVVSGSRQGDFVKSQPYAHFGELSQYARVIDANL